MRACVALRGLLHPWRLAFRTAAMKSTQRRDMIASITSQKGGGSGCVGSPIRPSCTKNSRRAIRRLGSELRTSHKPSLSGRQSGMPIGQPSWTVARSVPIARLSSGRLLSHSSTVSGDVLIKSASFAEDREISASSRAKDYTLEPYDRLVEAVSASEPTFLRSRLKSNKSGYAVRGGTDTSTGTLRGIL
jgi:hypothetical protein